MRIWRASILLLLAATATGAPEVFAQPDCPRSIPELYERVSPSVVFISAVAINPFKLTNRVSEVIGSGVIIGDDGLVLTSSHVVFGRRAITVTLDGGQRARPKILGADPILDLAVLRIPVPHDGLPGLRLGDSDAVRVGDEVLAIGNPLGLEQTLTRGIVSGVNRILPESPMSLTLPLIQTDAPINPGNSGGPLLNRCGEVIGINSSVLSGAQNIGFAVPINVAKRVLPQLISEGRVIRPWIGISGKAISKELRAIFNLPPVEGFLVETIEPGSPAERAGLNEGELPITIAGEEFLLGGDIITAINGNPLKGAHVLEQVLRSLEIGDRVRLTLFREGKTLEVALQIEDRPILPGDLPSDEQRSFSPAGQAAKRRLGF